MIAVPHGPKEPKGKNDLKHLSQTFVLSIYLEILF